MLPNDPMMLLSYVNTKLRDEFSDLNLLCQELQVERSEIEKKLGGIDYEYDEQLNKFV